MFAFRYKYYQRKEIINLRKQECEFALRCEKNESNGVGILLVCLHPLRRSRLGPFPARRSTNCNTVLPIFSNGLRKNRNLKRLLILRFLNCFLSEFFFFTFFNQKRQNNENFWNNENLMRVPKNRCGPQKNNVGREVHGLPKSVTRRRIMVESPL